MAESREPVDEAPDDEEMQEPSTAKEPGDQPTDGDSTPEGVDHRAVGIGVVEIPSDEDDGPGANASPPHPTAAEMARADSAAPTGAATDEVRSDAAGMDESDE